MTDSTEAAVDRAILEVELEDRFQALEPPDLCPTILAGTALPRGRARADRSWWIAAAIVLGLSVIPAVALLQRAADDARPGVHDDARSDVQDPARTVVRPTNPDELVRWLQRSEGLEGRVEDALGVPIAAPGEPDVAFVRLFGEGSRSDLGWLREQVATDVTGLAALFAPAAEPAAIVAGPRGLTRRVELRVMLPERKVMPLWAELPGGTAYCGNDGQTVAIQPHEGVVLRAGDVSVAMKGRDVRSAWVAMDDLVTATLCLDRGVLLGSVLDGRLGKTAQAMARESARRVDALRPHGVTFEDLHDLAEGAVARRLDLRWCVSRGDLMETVRRFAHLETLIVNGRLGSDPFGDAVMPGLRELVVCSVREDPFGDLRAPEARFLGRSFDRPVFRAFPGLRVLRIPGAPVGDSDLAALPSTLEELCLQFRFQDGGRQAGSAGLLAVARLPHLRRLELGAARNGLNPRDDDPGLDVIEALAGASRLECLELDRWFDRAGRGTVAITADDPDRRQRALAKLATLPHLRVLSLRDNPELVEADVAALRDAPQIEVLDLSGCPDLDGEDVFTIWDVDRRPEPDTENYVVPDVGPELRGRLPATATVTIVVGADGWVRSAAVERASDIDVGEAIAGSLRRSRYHPAQKDGVPVAVRWTQSLGLVPPRNGQGR